LRVVRGEAMEAMGSWEAGGGWKRWWRGPAKLDGEWIVLDRARAEEYRMADMLEKSVASDFAAIKHPREALEFVAQYGLLEHGIPGADDHRERWSVWEGRARQVSDLFTMYRALTGAMAGEAEALDALWKEALPNVLTRPVVRVQREGRTVEQLYVKPQDPATDEELFLLASRWIMAIINVGLRGGSGEHHVEMWIDVEEPGHFVIAPMPPNVAALVYYQAALHIVQHDPLGRCEECSRFFHIADRRQRYCSATCAGRARQRRWARRKRAGVVVEDQAVP